MEVTIHHEFSSAQVWYSLRREILHDGDDVETEEKSFQTLGNDAEKKEREKTSGLC